MNRNNRMRNKYNNRPQGGGHNGHGDDEVGGRSFKQLAASRDKYLAMARDALSSGDRVLSEYYLQHADHYFRLMKLAQPEPQQHQHSHHHQRQRHENQEGAAADGQPTPAEAQNAAESFPEPVSSDEPVATPRNGGHAPQANGPAGSITGNMPAFLREPLPMDGKESPAAESE